MPIPRAGSSHATALLASSLYVCTANKVALRILTWALLALQLMLFKLDTSCLPTYLPAVPGQAVKIFTAWYTPSLAAMSVLSQL